MKAGSHHTEDAKAKMRLSQGTAEVMAKTSQTQFKKGGICLNRKPSRLDSRGCVLIYVPDHPFATKAGYMFEHRLVVEKDMKGFLGPDEEIHHWDGNRSNNALTNLLVTNRAGHKTVHGEERRRARNRV